MNDKTATNHIRSAIDSAIARYHSESFVKQATHRNALGSHYRKQFGLWYRYSPYSHQWEATAETGEGLELI